MGVTVFVDRVFKRWRGEMSGRMSVGLVLVLLVGLFGGFLHVGSAMALPDGFEEETFVEVLAPAA